MHNVLSSMSFFFLRIYFFLNISSTHLSKLYMETFSPLSLMLHVVLIFGLHNLLLEQGRKTIHKAKIKKKKKTKSNEPISSKRQSIYGWFKNVSLNLPMWMTSKIVIVPHALCFKHKFCKENDFEKLFHAQVPYHFRFNITKIELKVKLPFTFREKQKPFKLSVSVCDNN